MRPIQTILLLAILLHACGPMRQIQKVESQIPVLGSIGKQQSKLFKKDFQKMGEPILAAPITVSIQSVPLTSGMLAKYKKYREKQGLEPLVVQNDTTKSVMPHYFELTITDAVGFTTQLNHPDNQAVKDYLQEDTDLVLLSKISFKANAEVSERIQSSDYFYLNTDAKGSLSLVAGDNFTIKMSDLEVFDFETAKFCWKKDKRGRLEIGHILMDGNTCPGTTEANPKKLVRTPDYLKL
ncbi:hypothetical protein [Flagellimonas beolgyonensis]|uniref:hypothetical protein n=1 Tax=Flagellimonas beolgyonensis TaxID=864064 RepID=UPI003D661F92